MSMEEQEKSPNTPHRPDLKTRYRGIVLLLWAFLCVLPTLLETSFVPDGIIALLPFVICGVQLVSSEKPASVFAPWLPVTALASFWLAHGREIYHRFQPEFIVPEDTGPVLLALGLWVLSIVLLKKNWLAGSWTVLLRLVSLLLLLRGYGYSPEVQAFYIQAWTLLLLTLWYVERAFRIARGEAGGKLRAMRASSVLCGLLLVLAPGVLADVASGGGLFRSAVDGTVPGLPALALLALSALLCCERRDARGDGRSWKLYLTFEAHCLFTFLGVFLLLRFFRALPSVPSSLLLPLYPLGSILGLKKLERNQACFRLKPWAYLLVLFGAFSVSLWLLNRGWYASFLVGVAICAAAYHLLPDRQFLTGSAWYGWPLVYACLALEIGTLASVLHHGASSWAVLCLIFAVCGASLLIILLPHPSRLAVKWRYPLAVCLLSVLLCIPVSLLPNARMEHDFQQDSEEVALTLQPQRTLVAARYRQSNWTGLRQTDWTALTGWDGQAIPAQDSDRIIVESEDDSGMYSTFVVWNPDRRWGVYRQALRWWLDR